MVVTDQDLEQAKNLTATLKKAASAGGEVWVPTDDELARLNQYRAKLDEIKVKMERIGSWRPPLDAA